MQNRKQQKSKLVSIPSRFLLHPECNEGSLSNHAVACCSSFLSSFWFRPGRVPHQTGHEPSQMLSGLQMNVPPGGSIEATEIKVPAAITAFLTRMRVFPRTITGNCASC